LIGKVVDAMNELNFIKKRFMLRDFGRLASSNTEPSPIFFFNLIFSSQVGNRVQISLLFDASQGHFMGYRYQKSLPSTTVTAEAIQRIFDNSDLFSQQININSLRHRSLRSVCAQMKQLVATAAAPETTN